MPKVDIKKLAFAYCFKPRSNNKIGWTFAIGRTVRWSGCSLEYFRSSVFRLRVKNKKMLKYQQKVPRKWSRMRLFWSRRP